ncbi:hypothetical protein GCM10010275_29930 [Streptomyces litmocidini]|uniref:hypothetical protein n=1 Tax=Streptomyces litmocidini TaxID=67318 RepID=UPI00167EF761|nr:hypothetical protein [Streptomyces litmocidini]GGU90947.1 hypothetical protein GCM10010275_29930 [Streptomyces litmocidini]
MAVGNVQITGTGQLIELSRRLKMAGGPRLKQNFSRRIRRAGEPLKNDMQQTIRSLPITADPRKPGSRGGPSPTTRPLRATVAEAVRLSVRTAGNPGARIWMDTSLLPSDLKGMPKAMNKADGRIRHKVFGNKKRWVNQHTTPLWWDKTVQRHQSRMRAEVARVLDDVRRTIT